MDPLRIKNEEELTHSNVIHYGKIKGSANAINISMLTARALRWCTLFHNTIRSKPQNWSTFHLTSHEEKVEKLTSTRFFSNISEPQPHDDSNQANKLKKEQFVIII